LTPFLPFFFGGRVVPRAPVFPTQANLLMVVRSARHYRWEVPPHLSEPFRIQPSCPNPLGTLTTSNPFCFFLQVYISTVETLFPYSSIWDFFHDNSPEFLPLSSQGPFLPCVSLLSRDFALFIATGTTFANTIAHPTPCRDFFCFPIDTPGGRSCTRDRLFGWASLLSCS